MSIYDPEYTSSCLFILGLLVAFLLRRFLLRCAKAAIAFCQASVRVARRREAWPLPAMVRRELLTSLRLVRTYLLLAVSAGVVFGVVMSEVPTLGAARAGQAQAAMHVFTIYTTALYRVGWVFIPLLAAPAIASERQRQTLELLTVTMIKPRTIVLGKLVNVLGLYVLVAVATLPVIGVLFFFTGLDLADFVLAILTLMARVFVAASVGLLASALFQQNTLVAIGAAYLVLLMIEVFPLALTLIAALFCLRKAVRLVERPPTFLPQLEMPDLIKDPKRLRQRREQWPFYLIDPQRPKKPISDRSNPMFAKENRTGLFSQGSWRVRVFYCYIFLFIIIPFAAIEGREAALGTESLRALFIETMLILLVTPAAISASFAKENELGNLDMLRMTTLRPRQIVVGKFLSAAVLIAPLVLASVAGMCVMSPATGAHKALPALAVGYVSMLATLFFALSVGSVVSVFTRQTTVALVAGYGANAALLVLAPILGLYSMPPEMLLKIPTPLTFLTLSWRSGFDPAKFFKPGLLNALLSTGVGLALIAACVMVFTNRWAKDR